MSNIESANPWWVGEESIKPPAFRRWPFDRVLRLLKGGLAPATILRGPRRVGKTVLLQQAVRQLLSEGVDGRRILYASFDELPTQRNVQEPVLAIARWFQKTVLKTTFNKTAVEGRQAFLFFDEVQNLDAWAPQVKHLVDNHAVRALITVRTSRRIEASLNSLAGRITTLDMQERGKAG